MQGKQLVRYILCGILAITTACLAAVNPVVPTPGTNVAPITSAPASAPTPTPVVVNSPSPPSTLTPASTPVSVSPTPNTDSQIWNLKNADIHAVIQTISVLTGKNFIIDPRVHGTITLISQKPMTPDELYQVFLSMLQLLQYVAIPSGNAIKIVPAMDANTLSRQISTAANPGSGDEVVVRVVAVNHVSATELVPVLRPLMSQSGSVTAYLPSNALILAGTASNIKRLVAVIHQMDSVNSDQMSVVHLHYASAKKVVAIIHALQSGAASQGNASNATLAADDENNSILISANLSNQLVMKNLIHQLDQKSSGGDDTRVVTLNYLTAKKFAPILQKVAEGLNTSTTAVVGKGVAVNSGSAGGSDVSIQAEDTTNAIIMHAPTTMLNSLMHVIHRLDSRPREVLVEAIIVKVNENLLDQLGIIWGGSNNGGTSTTDANGNPTSSTGESIGAAGLFTFNANHQFGLLPDGNLIALLQALNTDGSTDVLATPSVVVLDNEKASIASGQNIGVANRSYEGPSTVTTGNPADTSSTAFNTLERQDVALSLDVVPHISPNHMIRMNLLQQDNSVVQSTANNTSSGSGTTNDNPTISISKIKTSVLVKSGDILVLGGLMDNEEDKSVQKLPVLGDLPLIGQLFRYNTHTLIKQDLMVFIRPVIMSRRSADKQTMNRYAYARHQELDIATEAIRKNPTPLLPKLKEPNVALPQPLTPVYLPAPTTTSEIIH